MLVCRPLAQLCPSASTTVSAAVRPGAGLSATCTSHFVVGALAGFGLLCTVIVLRAAIMAADAEQDTNWGLYWHTDVWGGTKHPLRRRPAGCCCSCLCWRCPCVAAFCGEHYHVPTRRAECVLLVLATPGLVAYGVVFPALMGAVMKAVDDTALALCALPAAALTPSDADWRAVMCTGPGYAPLRPNVGFALAFVSSVAQGGALYLAVTSIAVTRRAVRASRRPKLLFDQGDIAWHSRRHAVVAGALCTLTQLHTVPVRTRAGCGARCAAVGVWCCGEGPDSFPCDWPDAQVVAAASDVDVIGQRGRRRYA
jgi:hypothetical protein